MNKIDSLLAERGLTSEYKEQAVHQLFCQMIESDLKERKKRSEKIEKEILSLDTGAKEDFRKECLSFIGQYDEQQVTDFYYYWSETSKRGTMREE